MPLRLLSLLLVVNISTLLAGVALAAEPASTQLRGPRTTDTAVLPRQLGPLSPTDTLWRIAERVKPTAANVSTYQVMYAIYLKNPNAFIDDNLNHLRPGATIQLPDLREIRATDNVVARAKSDADDRAWAERAKAVSQQANRNPQPAAKAVSTEQLQQFTELKDQFGNSMLMIEAIARENNQLKATLSQVQTELLALQQQLGEDSSLQQQLNTLLQQQADILATQQAQELEAAEALAAEQAQGSNLFNNPLVWVLAASIPALLILSGVVLWLKRRGQQTEAAVVAANTAAAPPADYKSPLPPLDDNSDLDDSGLFDIDESLLDDAFADNGDFAGTEVLDDSLPDFNDDALLGDDILLDDDSLLANQARSTATPDDDLLNDVPEEQELTEDPVKTEFDANNILSDSDLNALLSAEDDDDAIIELDDEEFDFAPTNTEEPADPLATALLNEGNSDTDEAVESDGVAEDIVELDEDEVLPDVQTQQSAPAASDELAAEDELLEEIELDIPDVAEETELPPTMEPVIEPATEQTQLAEPILGDDEQIRVETDNSGAPLTNEQFTSELATSEPIINEQGHDELTESQIASLVEDESFDRTELDAFAESLALEGGQQNAESETAEEQHASERLSAELDELLQQVDTADSGAGAAETDDVANNADELADIDDIAANSDGPDLQSHEDDSVTKPSDAALSVENPSKMLESYPELALSDEDVSDEHGGRDDEAINVELSAADPDTDQSLTKLDDSQFDTLLTELEAMAQTTASDSEDLSLDVDSVFSPTLDDNDIVALSDADFVEIDNLLANSEQLQADDGRFEQLNVDVGLDEFADVIGNDNPQDVDKEDNGFAAKLDLVRAYIEIDDEDSAGQIIAEILDSTAPEHVKTEAKALQKPAN